MLDGVPISTTIFETHLAISGKAQGALPYDPAIRFQRNARAYVPVGIYKDVPRIVFVIAKQLEAIQMLVERREVNCGTRAGRNATQQLQ